MGVTAHVLGSGGLYLDMEAEDYIIALALGEVDGVGLEAAEAEARYAEPQRHGDLMGPLTFD